MIVNFLSQLSQTFSPRIPQLGDDAPQADHAGSRLPGNRRQLPLVLALDHHDRRRAAPDARAAPALSGVDGAADRTVEAEQLVQGPRDAVHEVSHAERPGHGGSAGQPGHPVPLGSVHAGRHGVSAENVPQLKRGLAT